MSENIIHQITLDCLINREIYEKHKNAEKNLKINKKDKKFYRRRILNLTRELLLTKKDNNINNINNIDDVLETTVTPDLLLTFNAYVKACIHNFKTIDKNDIIQEDYKNMILLEENISNNISTLENNVQNTTNNDNMLFMRSIKTKPSLDNFVKYTSKRQEEQIILPKIREINLEEPTLRNKGIKKKEKENNINIIYDENKKKQDK